MGVMESVARSRELAEWLALQLNSLGPMFDTRSHAASHSFITARQYHDGILILLSADEHSSISVFPIVRPLFEAYVEGIWLFACAGEDALDDFVVGKRRTLDSMINDLQSLDGDGGVRDLNSLYRQIEALIPFLGPRRRASRQNMAHETRTDREISSDATLLVLQFSARIRILSAAGLALLASDRELWRRILIESVARMPQWADVMA